MSNKLNIKKAIKRPGALTRKAQAAGEGVQQFAREHAGDKDLTGQQARFAKTLNKVRGGK
jgi:hypothetical protein